PFWLTGPLCPAGGRALAAAGMPEASRDDAQLVRRPVARESARAGRESRILRTRDYYDVLQVPRDSSEQEIRRAYKRLSLKVHPDKNQAPGADEAFKKVSQAVACLTDEAKRQTYDAYGDEDPPPQRAYPHRRQHGDVHGFTVRGGTRGHRRRDEDDLIFSIDSITLLQCVGRMSQALPVIVVLGAMLFAGGGGNRSGLKFSLTETGVFRNARTTPELEIEYWVADEFERHLERMAQDPRRDRQTRRELASFERQVEHYYVRSIRSECDAQDATRRKKILKVKYARGDAEELERAKGHPRPACATFERLHREHPGVLRQAGYAR
ncbi:unnamed protein product, partial [Prorocentrum cordatum]